jgi:sulfatase maturation enzyme AslB (radical SAM superfamily)
MKRISGKKMKTYILLRSRKGNTYLHDIKIKKTLPCHPVLYFIIKEIDQGRDVTHLCDQADNRPIDIDGFGSVSKPDFIYYFRKYLMLKENGYFGEINPKDILSPRLTPKDVKRSLTNCPIVTFETTDRCNLSCTYCGYGRFYSNYKKRGQSRIF